LFGIDSANLDLVVTAGLFVGGCLLFLAVVPPQFHDDDQVRDRLFHWYNGILFGTLLVAAFMSVFSLQLGALAVSTTIVVAGARTVVWDVRRDAPTRQFEGVEPSAPDAVEPGVAEVRGEVQAIDEPGTTALRERPYVASTWRVEEWNHVKKRSSPVAVGGGNWFAPAKGVATVPFEVVGEHGSIEVAPEGATVVDDTSTDVVAVDYNESPPDAVSRFLSRRDVPPRRDPPWDNYDAWNKVQGDRRYGETVIEPGDGVYVHGRAHEDANGSLVLTRREDAEHELVVSRYPKRTTTRKLAPGRRVALAGWLATTVDGVSLVATVVVALVF
jgi:hypothetical protein